MKQNIAHFRLALLVLAGLTFVAVVWTAPFWLLPHQGFSGLKDRLDAQNACRTTVAQILGGAFFLVTAYLTWRNLVLSQEGQITARFNNAIEHLGDDGSLAKRLGGIYALERIARDSQRDHWPIMEVLTGFIRNRFSWYDADRPDGVRLFACPTDIQAVLTVLGRRERSYERRDQRLDLQNTDLRGMDLTQTHLERANFSGAHLNGAKLAGADLAGALLLGAHLEAADATRRLEDGSLDRISLPDADLEGANVTDARYDDHTNWPEGFDSEQHGAVLAK